MLTKKSFINAFIMTTIAVVVSSCVPKATEKKAVCGTNQAYSSVTRSCYSIEELRAKPVGTKTTESLSEETPKTITLSYTDANKDLALSCKISAISSNVEVVSPLLLNNGLANKIDEVYDIAYTLANSIPNPSNVTADNYRLAMLASVIKIKTSFYHGTIISELSTFKTQATYLLSLATTFPSSVNVQNFYNLTQKKMQEFEPYIKQVENRCECNAGTCTTFVAPKLNKSGSAGFSYTITDIDGESPSRAVSLSIAAMPVSSSHLLPVAKSGTDSKIESNTSGRPIYTVTIPDAGDIAGTPALSFKYALSSAPTKGILSDCMGLNGSSSNDRDCNYRPASGDANNATPAATAATSAIGGVGSGVTFTAVAPGANGNNISIQYFSLQGDNSLADSYVNKASAFGLISSADAESFVRVSGNAIKIFINPDFTSSAKIRTLVNAHPQANKLVVASGGSASHFPIPGAVTPTAVNLAGGTNAFDTFSYTVGNQVANSTTPGTFTIDITPVNDYPMVPKTYTSGFSHAESMAEEATKAVTLGFTDVDSTVGFSIVGKFDPLPGCQTTTSQTYFDGIISSTNFTIGAIPAPTCTAGACTTPVSITANLNFTGAACFYYQITDSDGLKSDIQLVTFTVTAVNDAPLLSRDILPTVNPLQNKSVNEDLAAGLLSYTDMYASPGGGVWEEKQLLTVTLESSDEILLPSVSCKDYTPGAGSPIGVVLPSSSTAQYFDTTNFRCYVATGTASSNNWKLYPSLTAYPNCAYDVGYYGPGAPVVAASAGKRYLDTRNNKCYLSSATAWAQDASLSNYKIAYVPATDKSGFSDITVTVKDDVVTPPGTNLTSGVFRLTVNPIDDPPVFRKFITTIHTNEGGDVQTGAFSVDEDDGATLDEDAQPVYLYEVTSDNHSVLPPSAIKMFYDLNDNGVEDAPSEVRTVPAVAGINVASRFEAASANDVSKHDFFFKLDPVDGVSGNANITVKISTDGVTIIPKTFAFVVHPIAALHGGWSNISSTGLKTDKNGAPIADTEIQCSYNIASDAQKCNTTSGNCTSGTSPHGLVVPTAADVIFWDSTNKKCYRSTSNSEFSWVDLKTSCPITKQSGVCSGNNCILTDTPTNSILVPTFVGQYAYDKVNNKCYVSTGKVSETEWQEYVPSKVTLSWKPFTLVGNDPVVGSVSTAGWNVYRREAGTDYNFKGGHLKNTSSNAIFTITDSSIRTYTDTTAIAGKVYYYTVRPVDNTPRNFPTFTPEIFSEVRILAAPANYAFVHRWTVNQEVCNSMNITGGTSPYHVDASHNFRCEYVGPGMTDIGGDKYYDYGRDLLVDTQELGCAYAPAPACSANGCVGIGAPASTSGVAVNDLYYDRSAGTCYMYDGAWKAMDGAVATVITNIIANKTTSALNAPLVNISQAKAIDICEARDKPTLSGVTIPGAVKVTLPSKKDFIGYSSHKLNVSDAEITEMEQGFSLNIQSRCNGSKASGLETAYSDSPIPSTSFIYSLPGTASSNIRSLYTGSIAWGSSKGTEACVSRFGLQDLYGNVAEWTTDKMDCSSAFFSCTTTGTDFEMNEVVSPTLPTQYGFNLESGPFNDANGDARVGAPIAPVTGNDGYLTLWAFADQLFDSGKFNIPMGLPLSNSIINEMASESLLDWVLSIGPSSGITTAKLHEDGIITNHQAIATNASSKIGIFVTGGSYLSGNLSGRFSSEIVHEDVKRPDIGMRCILPIQSSYYQADTKHPYSSSY